MLLAALGVQAGAAASDAGRTDAEPAAAPPGQQRPLPDYDGRAPEPPKAGEVLIWIPRVLLGPIHAALEILLRRPLVGLITVAEEHHLIEHAKRLFTWDDGRAGLVPTFFYVFGLRPSAGLTFYWDDLGLPGHRIGVQTGFWDDKQQVAISDALEVFADRSATLEAEVLYQNRPDREFYGLGWRAPQADKSHYRISLWQAAVGLRARLGGLDRVGGRLFYRHAGFSPGEKPGIESRHAAAELAGYRTGYDLLGATLDIELDTRSPARDWTPGTGLRLEGWTTAAFDPTLPERALLRWGVELAGFLDLSGVNHVLGMRLTTVLAEPLGEAPIPFHELPALGGLERMRGFREGRMRGASTVVLTFNYRYPIWAYLDANLFVGSGNAFGPYLAGFSFERLRLVGGLGLRSNTSRKVSFDLMLAFGTSPFAADPFGIDDVHFVAGINRGF